MLRELPSSALEVGMALQVLQLASRFGDLELLQAMQQQLYAALACATVVKVGQVVRHLPLAQPLFHASIVYICRNSAACAQSFEVLAWLAELEASVVQPVVSALLGMPRGEEAAIAESSGGSPQSAARS